MPEKAFITKWLTVCCALVVLMVFVGGVTRLTDSGLSIVEWKPITGIIPPLTKQAWEEQFVEYQASPEYKGSDSSFSINDFKFIFWLEFIHRLLGRVTGLLYLLSLVYLVSKKIIRGQQLLPYLTILILFCAQGAMGWYMVKSGLVDQPYVSHFRLASHLIIAVIIYHMLFYQLMENNFDILLLPSDTNLRNAKLFSVLTIVVIYIQIFLGGLVAGLDAGLVYNSFPLMGDSLIPTEIREHFLDINYWSDPVFIQFVHRLGAYVTCTIILLFVYHLFMTKSRKLQKVACYVILSLLLQMSAGIMTIVYSVPIFIALLHQIGAIILLSCVLWGYFLVKTT